MVWAAAGVAAAGLVYNIVKSNTSSGGGGVAGNAETRQSQVEQDPVTQALNSLRYGQLNRAEAAGYGYPLMQQNISQFQNLSPDVLSFLNRGQQYAGQPGLESQDWYNQALSGLNGDQAAIGRNYYNQILQPQTQNQYALMGLGRSGAEMEAQAKGAASIALPMQHQYLQNLFGLNQQRPNIDISLRNAQLARLNQGMQLSDYQRQIGQGIAGQQLNASLSALNGTPYTPGNTTTGNQVTSPGLLTALGGSGVGSAVGGLAASGLFTSNPNSNPSYDNYSYNGSSDYSSNYIDPWATGEL